MTVEKMETKSMNSLARTTTDSVGHVGDLAVGAMKMARVGEHRIALIRTKAGYHAIDNACPHQGYGLVTGSLAGDLVTCQWHNWKFCVTDGSCVVGEEAVASHPVEIVDGEIMVSVTEPTDEDRIEALWPSLRSGVEKHYRGQIARDTVRLLEAGADPVDIVWEGIKFGAPRTDYGVDHEMASAADCLSMVDDYEGLARALPLSQALDGIAEETRGRPPAKVHSARSGIDFAAAVESENLDDASAALMHAIDGGQPPEDVRALFIGVVGRHHLNYGHGAIYTQKAFELLDRAGWDRAADLLPHLLTALVYGTREDTLPYMRKAIRVIDALDAEALVAPGLSRDPQWAGREELVETLLSSSEAPILAAVEAIKAGAGIEGVLDAVSLATSHRILRYDIDIEHDLSYAFGWLDITHGLTYSRAARWAWSLAPSAATVRLTLFAVFLCFDTGRAERRHGIATDTPVEPRDDGDLEQAILAGRVDEAVALAFGGERPATARALARTSLADGAGSFIVVAHLVKMARAAAEEAEATDSNLPLAAAARFAAAPRRERFVTRSVAEAIDFIETGQPPSR